jgi:hypothetical protein
MIIIVEGPDRTGKDTLIQGLVTSGILQSPDVIHCGSPKEPTKEYYYLYYKNLYHDLALLNHDVIMNRSAVGEYVYGPMYRNNEYKLDEIVDHTDYFDTQYFLFTLIDDPNTLIKREDGKSFGSSIEQKTEEVSRFVEITNYFNGYIVNCANKNTNDVLNEVIGKIGDV